MIDEQTTQETIDAYWGWHRFEEPHGIDIIDFNLLGEPRRGEEFKSREQVLGRLEELHGRIKPENNQEVFVERKLNASMYFLRALIGEEIPFPVYVKNITGVMPEKIDDRIIQKQKGEMKKYLKEVGKRLGIKSTKQILRKIRIYKKEAEERANMSLAKFIPIVLRTLEFEHLNIKFDIEFVRKKDYWKGWSKTRPDGSFLLLYNFHPMNKWYRGNMEILPLHEYFHFIQGENLRIGIRKGEINPITGLTTVHEPHTYVGEGTANGILDIPQVEKNLSLYGLLSREAAALGSYLYSNANIGVNEGMDLDGAVDYVVSNNPFYEKKRTRMVLKMCRDKPERRGYLYIYGDSRLKHRQLLEVSGPEKFIAYLRRALLRYEMPDRLMEFANKLISG